MAFPSSGSVIWPIESRFPQVNSSAFGKIFSPGLRNAVINQASIWGLILKVEIIVSELLFFPAKPGGFGVMRDWLAFLSFNSRIANVEEGDDVGLWR